VARSEGRRYFTLEQANEMVPRLEAAFGRMMQMRAQLKRVYLELQHHGFAPDDDSFSVEVAGAPPAVISARARLKALVETMREEIEALLGAGCLVKDLDSGLVDWFARRDGRDVFLCWRYGESEVRFWHELEAGFAGRRPVSEW
jgi:hypothetical protein